MASLRNIIDGRHFDSFKALKVLLAEGTSEGASKGWDSRGRGRMSREVGNTGCVGVACKDPVVPMKRGLLNGLELTLLSEGHNNPHFGRREVIDALRGAIQKLEAEEKAAHPKIDYVNDSKSTGNGFHYVHVKFNPKADRGGWMEY